LNFAQGARAAVVLKVLLAFGELCRRVAYRCDLADTRRRQLACAEREFARCVHR
jgi:hypothetical protein